MITNKRPSYIQFYPTLACNQTCSFCFNRKLDPVGDVAIPDFEKVISILSDLGISNIDILGGEPTLHPKFLELINLIHDNGLRATVSSNGTDVQTLEAISKKFDRNAVQIGISINDYKVGKGLHDYILNFYPVLKSIFDRRGVIAESGKPYINMPGIEYFLLYMDVVDLADLKNSVPFYDYYQKLKEIKQAGHNISGVFCSGFIPDTTHYPGLERVRCPAGTTKLSILPDGRVYPCYLFFRNPEFELGNILDDPFDTIWQHPVLDHFRRFDKNRCPKTGCKLFDSCHGGCPAMSFQFYKDLHSPDPRCMQDSF